MNIPLSDWTRADVLLGDLYSRTARQFADVGDNKKATELREMADRNYARAERIAARYVRLIDAAPGEVEE